MRGDFITLIHQSAGESFSGNITVTFEGGVTNNAVLERRLGQSDFLLANTATQINLGFTCEEFRMSMTDPDGSRGDISVGGLVQYVESTELPPTSVVPR